MKAKGRGEERINNFNLDELFEGVLRCDVPLLARAITLVESNHPKHFQFAQELINRILPYSGNSIRVGVTGSPGVGKSTFIESLGLYLCGREHKVAVLAIDPSSTISKGSILGDKTRMERLAQNENAFIRPSPSGGALGGVARKTRETILLCEAAGFDVVLIETVGVGQSEVIVRSMVDFFLLLILPGGGDELQGFKKGVVEIADTIVINKADGENINLAKLTKAEYQQALHYLSPRNGWQPKVLTASAAEGTGIEDVWNVIQEYVKYAKDNHIFYERRMQQNLDWVHSQIREFLLNTILNHPDTKEFLNDVEQKIMQGRLNPTSAVKQFIDMVQNGNFIWFK